MKSRKWTFLHYKEHGNQRFLYNYLSEKNLTFAISPCHNHDYDKQGKKIKDHYHVILLFTGPFDKKNLVEEIISPLQDPKKCFKVYSITGLDQYLTHENSSKKYKYDRKKIVYSNNWIVPKEDTATIVYIQTIEKIVKENKITNYYGLMSKLIDLNDSELVEFCVKRAYMVDKFICSRYYAR